MALTLGHVLHGRYRIDQLIAKGGMGAVYAAQDLTLEIRCAIKENSLSSEGAQRQFEREARLLATLRHGGLPNVTDHFVIPDQGQYLVMTFIEGEDLSQRLHRLGQLSEEDVQRWAIDVLEAVAYLHSRNIIHRDIKPANIKISPEGHAVVVDFGIAKEMDAIDVSTTTGARRLTPGFAPPEQYGAGTSRTDARSDVYALGATFYALLTGILPADALTRLMDPEIYVPLALPGLKFNPALVQVIDQALSLDPKKRYANAQEMLAELKTGLADPSQIVVMAVPASVPVRIHGPVSVSKIPFTDSDPLRTDVVGMGTTSASVPAVLPRAIVAVESTPQRRYGWWIALALLLLLLLLGWLIWGRSLLASATPPDTATVTLTNTATATYTTQANSNTQLSDATSTAVLQSITQEATSTQTLVVPMATTAALASTSLVDAVTQTAMAFEATSQSIAATQTASVQLNKSTTATATRSTGQPSLTATLTPSATTMGASSSTATKTATNTATLQASLTASKTSTVGVTSTFTKTPTFTSTTQSTATSTRTPTSTNTTPPQPTATTKPSISINPSNAGVVVGASTNLSVVINVAQSSDVVVSLSSDSGAVSVPNSVTITSGATSAQFTATGQYAGSATITGTLPGGFGGGSSQATVNVNKADTSVNISANPNPATAGQQVSVSFNVSVSSPGSGSPSGSVTISDGNGTICSANPPSGSCNYVVSSTGTKNLTATYSGDSNFNGSGSSPLSLNVNALGISLAPPNTCSTGTNVQLTASITAAQAGDITIGLSSSSSGVVSVPSSVTISAGSLSNNFNVTGLLIGQTTITATLPGNLGGNSANATVKFALPLVGC